MADSKDYKVYPASCCIGQWLPSDTKKLNLWVKKLVEEVEGQGEEDVDSDEVHAVEADIGKAIPGLLPPVQSLKDLIESDSEINLLFHQMFSQVPRREPFNEDPRDHRQIRNYRVFLRVVNHILTRAPIFATWDFVAVPICAILTWPMGTIGGYAAFLNPRINEHFKRILCQWGLFLKSPDSAYVLSEDPENGWLGESAMKAMPHFKETFKCDPSKPHWGYTSWDDFFTREFREGIRPVASPDDDKVICNACESHPLKPKHNVRRRDKLWIKSKSYSMLFLLNNDSLAEQFIGGTVYQAFLSALSYHRWHSPVSGKIVKAYVVNGTYYSDLQFDGMYYADPGDETDGNIVESQRYISEVATRALIFIEANNPYIGLVCFIGIGMGEVSTCDITVYEGQQVKKGDQLGMFHFGGSTHCLAFRPGVELDFDFHGISPGLTGTSNVKNIHVRAKLATVPQ